MDTWASIQDSRNSSSGHRIFELVESQTHAPRSYEHGYLRSEQHPVLTYWRILKKRKWTALVTLAIVFALAVLSTLRMTPFYEAVSRIAIYPENSNALGLKDLELGATAEEYDYNVALETQLSILRSDALALKVIEALHLETDPRFGGYDVTARGASQNIPVANVETDSRQIASMLGLFRSGLSVQVVPRTRVIQITYTHSDPKMASEIANTLVRTFIEENFRTKYETTSQTADWLSKELSDLQLKMEVSEEKLVRYEKEKGIVGIDEKQNIITAKLDELNKELTDAQTDRFQKEANYNLAQSGDPSGFARLSPDNLLEKLRAQQAELETQYTQATAQFGSSYPLVIQLKSQLNQVRTSIANEQKNLLAKVRDEYLAAIQRENLLTSAFDKQKQEANKLNESGIEYTALKRDADSNRQLYESLLQRLKEASVTAGLRSSNIRVVDEARVPVGPSAPNVPRNIALGFLLGAACGVVLAFLQESIKTTVGNLEELSAVTPLPLLGTIPLQLVENGWRRLTSGKSTNAESVMAGPVSQVRPKSEAAESYRALRTSVLLSSFGAPPKIILVTSALPQEGKTTVSTNSAVVLAQKGARVLLVDADLRRPGIGKIMGLKTSGGLSTLLSGMHGTKDVVVPFPELPNLQVLPAGPIPPNPVELLGSSVMKDLVTRWRSEFDHVIFDTPPCLSVTDSVVLSVDADRVILVARADQTPKVALQRASELLLQVNARVMGIVLNAFNTRSANGHYYSYGSTYSSGYYEQSGDDRNACAS